MTGHGIWDVAESSGSLEEFYHEMTEFEEPYDVAQLLKPDSRSAAINSGEFHINPEAADKELFLHKQGKNRTANGFIKSLGYDRHRDTEFEDLIDKKTQTGPFRGRDKYELSGKIAGKLGVVGGFGGILAELAGHETALAGVAAVIAGTGTLSATYEYGIGVNDALNDRIDELVDQDYAETVVEKRGDIPVNISMNPRGFEDTEIQEEYQASQWNAQFLKNIDSPYMLE